MNLRRRTVASLVDQAVIASANAGNVALGVFLLPTQDITGVMMLSLAVAYFVQGMGRSFVGEVLLAKASRTEGQERERLVRNGACAALLLGVLAAIVLLGAWAVWPRGREVDLSDLIGIAPLLPAVLLHDAGRFTHLADRAPLRALAMDLTWVGTQAVAVLAVVLTHQVSGVSLLACWGTGAVAGSLVFLVTSRVNPLRGDPRQWVAETRDLSGWFTATALVGQVQVLAIGFLVTGVLSQSAMAVMRAAQTAILQPMQNFMMAMMGLLVPRSSRFAAAGGVAALRRQTRRLAIGFGAIGVAFILVAVPLVGPVVHRVLPDYHAIVPLALPLALQAAIYLVQIPYAAAIRGMQRGVALFIQYVFFTATSLTGLVVGAYVGHLAGAVWGLTVGSAVGLVVMMALYRSAVRRLAESGPTGQGTGVLDEQAVIDA